MSTTVYCVKLFTQDLRKIELRSLSLENKDGYDYGSVRLQTALTGEVCKSYYYDGELTKEDLYPLSKETDEEEEKC